MAKAVTVYQYEQPRCPEGWNESERRFYARIIETLDDIYSKYGRIDEKLLSSSFVTKVNNAPDVALKKLEDAYSSATVDDLMTKSLTANAARIVELTVEKMIADTVVAGQITAGTLESTFAYMVSLSAKFGSFDFETVQNLVSGAMVLEKGSADSLYIKNLSVLYAQILNATIGSLCIQASDGNYYQIDVTENLDGEAIVNATKVEVNEAEISSGQTESGKVILDTDILAERLTTGTLFATEALTNSLLAAKIDVDTLTARSAFIQKLTSSEAFIDRLVSNTAFIHELTTRKIIGEKSLEMIAGTADAAQSSADTAQSAADAAQGTADGAMLATAHVGVNPPEAPIPAGRQWLDQGVEPWTLRSWIGADVRTEPEYAQTHSGNPVVLDDGRVLSLDSIRNSFGPVQAGSGDPYPAGGGKNLLDLSQGYGYDKLKPLNVPAGTSITFSLFTTNGTSQFNGRIIYEDNTEYNFAIIGKNADNNIWHTYTITPEKQIKEYSIYDVDFSNKRTISKGMIELGSAATEYAPYANIRPISGRTGVKLTRCGKNLLGGFAGKTQNGLTFTINADGSVSVNGTSTAQTELSAPIYLPAGNYYLSGCPAGGTSSNVSGGYAQYCYINGSAYKFDTGSGIHLNIAYAQKIYENIVIRGGTTINKTFYPQIETGYVKTEYEPYTGDTYAADFGQTVYGGTLDWAAGVLAVEWAKRELTGKEYWWAASSINGNSRFGMNVKAEYGDNFVGASTNQDIAPLLCDRYPAGSDSQNYRENQVISLNGAGDMNIYDPQYAAGDLASWKAYLAAQYAAGTPVQVCYRLAEPVVVHLNLPAVYPLEGTNVLYGGAGALEVDSTASGWRVVNDPAELQSAQEALALQQARMDEALNRLGMAMVLDADGVHVHRPVTNPPCETLTADDSFNVLVNSAIAATFAASYQKMGGQIVVRQTSNGLIFGG